MTLTGPAHKKYMPLFGAFWGLGLGWQLPMHSTAFINMIPRGQEAELMGLYILSGQILAWMPPMLFTALNEAGVDMAYCFASLGIFFFVAIVCLLMVGNGGNDFDSVSLHDMHRQRSEDSGYSAQEEALESVMEMNTIVHGQQDVQHRNGYTLPTIT